MEEVRIGVYICDCGANIAGTVDTKKVTEYAQGLDSVVVARNYKYMCSDPGQNLIKDDIREKKLNRVVVASCSPRMHEPTFRRAVQDAGINQYYFQMANIREQCSWVHENKEMATEKAKALVEAAVHRVVFHEPLQTKEVAVNPNVMVVGGGIAGIQAALEIADAGKKVYLVEKEPSIGGHMAMFDKTFPTLDCAACILTPKMTTVGQHPNINLLSYSEVEEVSGFVGNFKAKIKRKARYVDETKCTGCGECSKVCPVHVDNEFDVGLSQRSAAYIQSPYAVPNKAVIDKKGNSPCRVACPAGVNAHAYVALISQGKFKEALEVVRKSIPLAGVVGRVCYHPCEGECERATVDEGLTIRDLKRFVADYEMKIGREKAGPAEITKEDRVAVVGSGPAGLACAFDLIKKGYRVTVFEKSEKAGGLMRYGIPNFKLPENIVDNEIEYIKELGVEIQTGTAVKDIARLFNQGYKAVFLGTGAGKNHKLGIPNEDNQNVFPALSFLYKINSGDKISIGDRVIVIGGGNMAVESARAAWRLGARDVTVVYRKSEAEIPASDSEVEEALNEGIKFKYSTAANEIIVRDGKVSGVKCISEEKGQQSAEFVLDADSVINAVGQEIDKTELPGEMAYSDLGYLQVDPITLESNISGVFAGGENVAGQLDVIASVAAGKAAAESIGRYLSGVDMREGRSDNMPRVSNIKKDKVKPKSRVAMPKLELSKRQGNYHEVDLGFDESTAIEEAKRCLNCAVCSECMLCEKACEADAIKHDMKEQTLEIEIGSIIVATGFQQFDPEVMYNYGYNRFDDVLTGLEFERLSNASGPTDGVVIKKNGEKPQSVAILHCVGSRDENYHKHCSRVCCMYSLKYSHLLREKLPDADIYQLYIDMRCPGSGYEEFYLRLQEEGVNFVRGRAAEVTNTAETPEEQGKLIVLCEDTLVRKKIRLPVDMVILSCALEPSEGSAQIGKVLSISKKADGFFLEKHPKLDPVSTMTDGIFIAGCCQGPKDIPDTVAQASAAAARALAMISMNKVEIEAATSEIIDELCSGCRICNTLCPYGAITFNEAKGISEINQVLCKGCGVCVSACPSNAIKGNHFTTKQLIAEIEGVLA
ncbi:MAG: FAD-dependent oxidoreductase [Dehalococcoidales bacterium]|nr:FAD-dependent oxidoreductase [Dehalococcoidales bacterium]